jgi:hypothetical protein
VERASGNDIWHEATWSLHQGRHSVEISIPKHEILELSTYESLYSKRGDSKMTSDGL